MRLMAITAACAVVIAIGGCGKNEAAKQDQTVAESKTPAIDQSNPLAVAKAFWTAATEEDTGKLLALTAEEAREEVKNGLIPHLKQISAGYKGKPIDVTGDGKTPNAPAKIREKDGKKYAEVCAVLGGIGTKEENGQDVKLVLKDGKWFVTSKR